MSNNAERLTLVEKLALVQSRARIMGFRRHDLEDAVQEVMLSVLEFQYDPEQPNGGTETTALTTVIDRKLVSLKRVRRRHTKIAQ
jgi:DNA-directed RNA polymerase specialized sigma24 family protein